MIKEDVKIELTILDKRLIKKKLSIESQRMTD